LGAGLHRIAQWHQEGVTMNRSRSLKRLLIMWLLAPLLLVVLPTSAAFLSFVEIQRDGIGGVDGLLATYSTAISPDGKHIYAAGLEGLAVFSRNAATGKLTFAQVLKDGVGGVDGLAGAHTTVVSSDGKHVYVASETDNAVAVFSRNATTGALTFVEVQKDGVGGVDGLAGIQSVFISPDGKHVYIAGNTDNAVAVFSRNATTGALTFVEVQKDGVGGVDGLDLATSVTVSPDNKHVYATGILSVAAFSRNTSTGVLSFIEFKRDDSGGVDGLNGAAWVTTSPNGQHVYIAGGNDNAVAVFSRNATTGALTFVEVQKDGIGGIDGLQFVNSIAVSLDNQYIYAAGTLDNAVAVFRAGAPPPPTLTPSTTATVKPGATPTATPDRRTNYMPVIVKPLPPTATPTPTVPPTATPTAGPTPTSQPGGPPFGNTLRLDGVDDYATAPDSSNLRIGDEPGESLAIEAWLLIDDVTPSSVQSLPVAGKLLDYELYVRLGPESANGCIGMILRVSFSSFVIFSRCTTITPGWHHVAGIYNRSNGAVSVYLDGQRVGDPSSFLGSAIYNSDANLHVGGTEDTTTPRPAVRIEELRISDSVRYTGTTYIVPKRLSCDAQTRALWHFDEPTGATTIYDGGDGSSSDCGGIEDTLTGINGASTGP
jgi:6-phosphogluconolactonase (cycloisomerase 2 family)